MIKNVYTKENVKELCVNSKAILIFQYPIFKIKSLYTQFKISKESLIDFEKREKAMKE